MPATMPTTMIPVAMPAKMRARTRSVAMSFSMLFIFSSILLTRSSNVVNLLSKYRSNLSTSVDVIGTF